MLELQPVEQQPRLRVGLLLHSLALERQHRLVMLERLRRIAARLAAVVQTLVHAQQHRVVVGLVGLRERLLVQRDGRVDVAAAPLQHRAVGEHRQRQAAVAVLIGQPLGFVDVAQRIVVASQSKLHHAEVAVADRDPVRVARGLCERERIVRIGQRALQLFFGGGGCRRLGRRAREQAAQVVQCAEHLLAAIDLLCDVQSLQLEALGAFGVAHQLVRDAGAIQGPAHQRRVFGRARGIECFGHVDQCVGVQADLVVGHCQRTQQLRSLGRIARSLEHRNRLQRVADRRFGVAEPPLVQREQAERRRLQPLLPRIARELECMHRRSHTGAMVARTARVRCVFERGACLLEQNGSGTAAGHDHE